MPRKVTIEDVHTHAEWWALTVAEAQRSRYSTVHMNGEHMAELLDAMQHLTRRAIEHRVFSALGAASVCWGETPKGIFDSTQAKKIGDELVDFILGKCRWPTKDQCWDEQEALADRDFSCPVHGRAEQTLERLGVDVL